MVNSFLTNLLQGRQLRLELAREYLREIDSVASDIAGNLVRGERNTPYQYWGDNMGEYSWSFSVTGGD